MHYLMRLRVLFVRFARGTDARTPGFSGSGFGLPISYFKLFLVAVHLSHRAASTGLLNSCPSMRTGIWSIRINRTAETTSDENLGLVSMLHWLPFAFAMTADLKARRCCSLWTGYSLIIFAMSSQKES